MYMNSGYYKNSLIDFMDKSKPLIVGSCGTYKLTNLPKLPTYRPKGRLDYQIIYIASGSAHFHFEREENETIVPAGHMVLYRPKEFQKYEYYGTDHTEVYWIHFTGNAVKQYLKKCGISDNTHTFYAGFFHDYEKIFKEIILELQKCESGYEEMLTLLFQQLLITIHRGISKEGMTENKYLDEEIELAAQYFNTHYQQEINIRDYAASRGMSISYFIRHFREYTGVTPMQYILSTRIHNARELLVTTSYSITEIAQLVGYDNPFYFSRLFHKQNGMSPSAFRRKHQN